MADPRRTAASFLVGRPTASEAEQAGYDASKHGADTTNCNFRFFATPELTAAWERGHKRAKAEGDGRAPARPRRSP